MQLFQKKIFGPGTTVLIISNEKKNVRYYENA